MSTKTPKSTRTAAKTPASSRRSLKASPLPAAKAPKATKSARKAAPPKALESGSKQSQLVSLLQSSTGATIEQMTTATGWQAHTVRGTISGVLRKRLGLNVQCFEAVNGNARVYRIVGAAA